MANDMLARTTVAGQEGVIEYLANSSALQHFEQTALAYLLLQKAGRAVSATQLASDTEGLLEDRFGVSMADACVTAGRLLCPVQTLSSVPRGRRQESSHVRATTARYPQLPQHHSAMLALAHTAPPSPGDMRTLRYKAPGAEELHR